MILLVEDNPDDAGLTMRSLKKNNLSNNLLHLEDGEEALEYLEKHNHNKLPKVILLDLKMPKVDGLEVLRIIKKDPILKLIPVVILTSSKEEQDLVQSYSLGANSYIRKPIDFDNFMDAANQMGMYWLLLNEVPY